MKKKFVHIDLKFLQRDIYNKRFSVISKTEALLFTKLFLPEDEQYSGEARLATICIQLQKSLSNVLQNHAHEEDLKLLERGYKKLPKRWARVKNSLRSGPLDRQTLLSEMQYLKSCDQAFKTHRKTDFILYK